jgi:tetratricopeptide (TPR) repeat protein
MPLCCHTSPPKGSDLLKSFSWHLISSFQSNTYMKTIRFVTLLVVAFFTATTIINAQSEEKVYYPDDYPKLGFDKEMHRNRAGIDNWLNGKYNKAEILDVKNNLRGTPKDILVLDDRIEFNIKGQHSVIRFSDIVDDEILTNGTTPITRNDDGRVIYQSRNDSCHVRLNEFYFFLKGRWVCCPCLADDFFFIQLEFRKKEYESRLNLFEPIAMQYRSLKVKPPVSEEQRKYIVQANALNQQKLYCKAIERYNKAIENDQTAYPAAYFNIALLNAQLNDFETAIYNMKKYLLLEPEAPDARSAQDKIYEWEIKMQN